MTYQEFIEKVKTQAHEELGYSMDLMKFYPEGFTSDDPQMIEWIKDSNNRFVGEENTRLLTDFLTMEVPEENGHSSIHRIAIRRMFENGEKNGFDAAFREISILQKDIDDAHVDPEKVELRATTDYEKIRDQLILRPLNYSLHIRDLRGCVYRKVSDFALVLYQLLGDANHSLVTSKIKRDELKRWGMESQEDRVMRDALENTARLYPACVFDQRTGKEENFLEKEFTRQDITFHARCDQIILSTFKTTNGAVALFYPGVIEKMMKIMGGPFQAVFMNINDVMIFAKDDPMAYRFAQTAKESSKMGEMLSGKMYLCDGKQVIPGTVVKIYEDEKGRRAEVE